MNVTLSHEKSGRSAPGMEYKSIPGCSRAFFRCHRLAATLSTTSCASMYREANHTDAGLPGNRLMRCRSCPIGAAHAGEEVAVFNGLYGCAICPRCGKGTIRMIQARVCVSCRNREYELKKGRNARGTRPVKVRPLHPVRVSYRVNGVLFEHRAQLSTGLVETVVQILRVTEGSIIFAFHHLPQMSKKESYS